MSERLPDGWQRVSLSELGSLATSSVDKLTVDGEQAVNLVNYMDVYSRRFIDRSMQFQVVTASKDEVVRFQVQKGDILFTPSSETPDDIGHSAVVVDDLPATVHSYHTVRLRVQEDAKLHLRFRGWVANNEAVRRYLAQCATGSTRYTLSLGRLGSALVALPPLVQQERIAEILSTVDEAIEGTEKLIAKHQQIKAGLMHDLFTRGLTPDGHLRPPHTERPDLYKDSPLGPIPKEWEVQRLRDTAGDYGWISSGSGGCPRWGSALPVCILHPREQDLVRHSREDLAFDIQSDLGRAQAEARRDTVYSSRFLRIRCSSVL